MRAFSSLAALMLCGLLVACQSDPVGQRQVPSRGFELADLAKGDIDMVAEIHLGQSQEYLRELARKLYVRNPREWQRGHQASLERAIHRLFGPRRWERYPQLQGHRAAAAIGLAFAEEFDGDRVAAFIEGMRGMMLDAYGGKRRFYLHDSFDPQKIFYLARNFEIAFWKLGHDRHPDGRLILLSNSLEGHGDLSFERLAGKLIGLQDHMAQVVAESSNRQIKNVIQGVASAVFFPI